MWNPSYSLGREAAGGHSGAWDVGIHQQAQQQHLNLLRTGVATLVGTGRGLDMRGHNTSATANCHCQSKRRGYGSSRASCTELAFLLSRSLSFHLNPRALFWGRLGFSSQTPNGPPPFSLTSSKVPSVPRGPCNPDSVSELRRGPLPGGW